MNTFLFSQNKMNENLQKLFLDLDLTQNPHEIVKKSKLRFGNGTNRIINWGGTDTVADYVANFDKNPFIESKIKKGIVTIIPKKSDLRNNIFTINERIWFYNREDMLKEFEKICSLFEKQVYKVKRTIIQNESFETVSENTEIIIDTNHKLTIGYYLSAKSEDDKEYSMTFIYDN